jgi:hypothetical protein
MIQVNVRFGETISKSFPEGTTIGAVLSDRELKAVLGWGDNVRALVHGVEQPVTALAPDGATIVVETRANSKAN